MDQSNFTPDFRIFTLAQYARRTLGINEFLYAAFVMDIRSRSPRLVNYCNVVEIITNNVQGVLIQKNPEMCGSCEHDKLKPHH